MRKGSEKLLITALLVTLVLGTFGCTRDTFEAEQEPDCSVDITDEDYEVPAVMLLGIGRGAIAAARLRGESPDRFSLMATVGGPASLAGLLVQVRTLMETYDDWATPPSRPERLQFLDEFLRAFGNPLYLNLSSDFYPPGTSAEDFDETQTFTPKTIDGFVDRLNPNGALPVVTFADASGMTVPFAVALDKNENGQRDSGEPIIVQMNEDFSDSNDNGLYDLGEPFNDLGIDGVANTLDYGEANSRFDYAPGAERFIEADLAAVTEAITLEEDRLFVGAVYADLGADNSWGFDGSNALLFDRLAALSDGALDTHCLENTAAVYDRFLWKEPYPVIRPFVPERFVWMRTPDSDGADLDPLDEDREPLRARRMLQALHMLSARSPNWLVDEPEKDSPVIWEEHSFISTTGFRIRYGIGLPAGYYDERSRWKTYPTLYVLPDKGYEPADWIDLVTYQGWLAVNEYAQQTLLVILDPDAESFGGTGYSFFTGPADPRPGEVDAQSIFEEIFEHVESRYRTQRD